MFLISLNGLVGGKPGIFNEPYNPIDASQKNRASMNICRDNQLAGNCGDDRRSEELLGNHHVVAMNQLIVFTVTENIGDKFSAFTHDAEGFVRIVIDQPSSNFLAISIDTAD